MPGRVVPLFRATWKTSYKILTSTKFAADRREVSSLPICAIVGNQSLKYSRKESSWRFGDRCTLPWEGRVTGPLSLQELSFSFDDVHQIEALSKCRKSSTSLPGSRRNPRSRYYKIFDFPQIAADRRRSPPSYRACGESNL